MVELWLATPEGPIRILSEPQEHVTFVCDDDAAALRNAAQKNGVQCTLVDNRLKTLSHQRALTVKTPNDRHFRRLKQTARVAGITLFEADIKLADRYLMERFVYGGVAYHAGRIDTNGNLIARIKPASFTPDLSYLSIDIECDETGSLYSIGCTYKDQCVVFMLDNNHTQSDAQQQDHFALRWCSSEKQLLEKFSQYVCEHDPDLLIGWNVKQFDMRVLHERASLHNLKLSIGRDGTSLHVRSDGNSTFISLPGRAVICGIEALKSMTYAFESFSLNVVAGELLGESKAIDNPQDRLHQIKRMFADDKEALARYNIQDCILVEKIFSKVNLIEYLVLRATLTGLELGRPGGSVAAFLNLYLPKLHRAGFISPNRPDDGGLASPGGYVMSSKPGLYEHVLILDFKSLYPSIIRTFKVDPLGMALGEYEEDPIPGFKGAVFSRTQHFLPDIITTLWQQRDIAKAQKNAALSQAIKIIMNSFYGVLGSGGCPLYSTQLASSITMRGHQIMQTTAQWIEELGFDVIYGDTDSTFVWLKNVTNEQQAREIGQSIQHTINQKWQQWLKTNFNLQSHLEIEFETHFNRFFMPTIRGSEQGSKKRYAGLIKTDNGTDMVFKGLENVRSDWTQLAKEFQYELYRRVFNDEAVEQYVKDMVEQTRTGYFDDKLVYTKRLRKPVQEYTKTVPPHVKAAKIAASFQHDSAFEQQLGSPTVKYVITVNGPEPVSHRSSNIDYEHYVEKQLRPIADSILGYLNVNFDALCDQQMLLFEQ